MRFCDINPHLRFASELLYRAEANTVKATDCRIFYITDGTAELEIDGQHYTLLPHCLFYCRGGSIYTIETRNGFSLISLNFDLSQQYAAHTQPFRTYADRTRWEDMPVYFQNVDDSTFLNTHLFLANAGTLSHYIEDIVSEFCTNAPYFRELCSTTLKALLIELHRLHQIDLPPKVAFVKDYIQQHYAENITNKDLASLVGYHEYYLNRIFSAYMGTNLHNYLLKVRLNHASILILNTDLNLNAIPELVGFRNYPHFSSYFKQAYGYSPAQYRKRLKGSI